MYPTLIVCGHRLVSYGDLDLSILIHNTEEGGLLDRLKKTLTRSKDSDEPDSSSFATFGQLLSVCPVSHENKVSEGMKMP